MRLQSNLIIQSSLFVLVLFQWEAADESHNGFKIHVGDAPGSYSQVFDITDPDATTLEVEIDTTTSKFAAIQATGVWGDSELSAPAEFGGAPGIPTQLQIVPAP